MLLRSGCAVVVNQSERLFDQPLDQLLRVGDGRRATDELRARAVESADAFQAAEDVGHVAAKHPAIGVHFVHDYVPQTGEQAGPFGVMGQDTGV